MYNWKRFALPLFVVIPLALAAGCLLDSDDDDGGGGNVILPVHPLTHPDSLVLSLVEAMEARDAGVYGALLYDGAAPAPDAQAYAGYVFHPVAGTADPETGELLEPFDYDTERAIMANLFAGHDGWDGYQAIPGVRSIEVEFAGIGDWAPPATDSVMGHPWPEGTLWRRFSTYILFTLKGTIPGSDICGFQVQDAADLYAIPVAAGDTTTYRLWKWRDIHVWKSQTTSLSSVKALYRP
ncbi:MAG: hypothetical protein JW819_13450 [Candidatus Krumholzibacteriota bacterium]|nr:hypothetical protein [Candidatus Krumholzibacteriota bacterium]